MKTYMIAVGATVCAVVFEGCKDDGDTNQCGNDPCQYGQCVVESEGYATIQWDNLNPGTCQNINCDINDANVADCAGGAADWQCVSGSGTEGAGTDGYCIRINGCSGAVDKQCNDGYTCIDGSCILDGGDGSFQTGSVSSGVDDGAITVTFNDAQDLNLTSGQAIVINATDLTANSTLSVVNASALYSNVNVKATRLVAADLLSADQDIVHEKFERNFWV